MKEESKDLQPVVQPSVENIILEIDSIDEETKGISRIQHERDAVNSVEVFLKTS